MNKEILIELATLLLETRKPAHVRTRNAIIALVAEELKELGEHEDVFLCITPNQIIHNPAADSRAIGLIEAYCNNYMIEKDKILCSNRRGEKLALLSVVQILYRAYKDARLTIKEFVN